MSGADQRVPSPADLTEVLIEARALGFLGPGPVEPHLRHAGGFADLARAQSALHPPLGHFSRILDLGSGGGLPGLVVASQWPECELLLLDAKERRCEFLTRAVQRLGLAPRVSVVCGRAEEAGHESGLRRGFDGVVVRSFGPPAVVAECAAPFLRQGGWLIVSEPPDSERGTDHPSRWPADALSSLGLEPGEFVKDEYGYQVLHQRDLCPQRFPRRTGMPSKRPLF